MASPSPSPLLLVCALNDVAANSVIAGLTKDQNEVLVPASEINKKWNIQNKYYSAEVHIQAVSDTSSLSDVAASSVEAVIIYVQNTKGESLKDADRRKEIISNTACDNNILLCDICNHRFSKEVALEWCSNNNFELIELHEEPEPVDESCPIIDYYGIERAIQTLHTYPWTNLQRVNESISTDLNLDYEDAEEEEPELEGMDHFCKLFAKMTEVSENAAAMPSEGRKAYAEEVVKAFWKAIGGDESELEDPLN